MTVKKSENACWSKCNFGDKRLTQRALYIGDCLRLKYGQALSTVFKNAGDLKRTYEFLANPKTSFEKVVEPSHYQTAKETKNLPLILSIGDTTFLDYKNIKLKREDYGPIGNGGNGLILHTSLAVAPDSGQPLGLLWEKVGKRTQKIKSGKKVNRAKVFEKKESYKWVEAIQKVSSIFQEVSEVEQPKVIHIFDREGDIAEVFAEVQRAEKCAFLVRAAHNRSLNEEENYLWNYVQNQPVSFEREISLTNNHKRKKRIAHLEVRFCQVKLRSPQRLKETNGFKIYAVYAKEINPLDGEEPINWMLLTTEVIESPESANTLLRWYTYRWLIEEYQKSSRAFSHRNFNFFSNSSVKSPFIIEKRGFIKRNNWMGN